MAEYQPKIHFVSLGNELESAGYFWRAAKGGADAHIVDFGEASFGTVFTDKPPVPVQAIRGSRMSRGIRSLLRQEVEPQEPVLSQKAKDEMVAFVALACAVHGYESDEAVFYRGPMGADDLQNFARASRRNLEERIATMGERPQAAPSPGDQPTHYSH